MCGIVGFYSFGEKREWGKMADAFERMLNVQKHRGPDDQGACLISYKDKKNISVRVGQYWNEKIDGALGFNRLSIRDLSQNGHQPMLARNNTVSIVFNGEIYNVEEYRNDLILKGYTFESTTDTEVILNMYLEYGINDTLSKLNGMFAVVIVDADKNRIYIARDKFGIKPMYYMVFEDMLYFSSEYKSFLYIPEYRTELNMDALSESLIFISAPNQTLLKGVLQVKPGEVLTVTNNKIVKEKYGELKTTDGCELSKKDLLEQVETKLKKAVKKQLVSDVKVGCQLSGGIDSSLVTYYASQENKQKLDSVSIIFDDPNMSEEKYIDVVTKKMNIDSHKYTFTSEDLMKDMRNVVWHLESIPTIPNSNALMFLTRKAKENVTVLLSGEGADEVFGGYVNYEMIYLAEHIMNNQRINEKLGNTSYLKKEIFRNNAKDIAEVGVFSTIYVEPELVSRVLGEEKNMNAIMRRCDEVRNYEGNSFQKFRKYEMDTYLPELLIRQDKMSMANSIENRVPFLDNELVEYIMQLRDRDLVCVADDAKGINSKSVLKRLCSEKFGRDFTYRPKYGFGLPMKYFMGTKIFRKFLNENIWESMKKRNVINYSYVFKLFERLAVLEQQEVELLWRMINMELFMQEFIDK